MIDKVKEFYSKLNKPVEVTGLDMVYIYLGLTLLYFSQAIKG